MSKLDFQTSPCKYYNMNAVEQLKIKDYFNDDVNEYRKINSSMELMFQDIVDIASNPSFKLDLKQVELFKEMLAHELYYNYVVLFSPINTDERPQ